MMKKILDFWEKHNIFTGTDSVLAGVSGGCDSMCLLHMLHSLSDKLGIKVYAAHFNHNLRGEESDGDEAFVKEYCRSIGVSCITASRDVKSYASENSLGIEEAARELRYTFFSEAAEKLGASRIATAHNADDNLETMLLNLARGTGTKGLCGIPPVRGNIVRPILPLTRQEIEAYLEANGIPHREDSTNASDDYSRNKLRHGAVPILRELNSSVCSSSVTTAELLREDDIYLTSLAEAYISENFRENALSASSLLQQPFPVASRVIRTLCGNSLTSQHVASVFDLARSPSPSAALSLPGLVLRREYDRILFAPLNDEHTFQSVTLTDGMSIVIAPLSLRVTCEKEEHSGIVHKSLTTFTFKCDTLCGNISLRPRESGDSICLSAKGGRKTLKKLFIEKKIPSPRRGMVPVIADDNGPIAVYGMGQDVKTFPAPGDRVLKVKIEEIRIYD